MKDPLLVFCSVVLIVCLAIKPAICDGKQRAKPSAGSTGQVITTKQFTLTGTAVNSPDKFKPSVVSTPTFTVTGSNTGASTGFVPKVIKTPLFSVTGKAFNTDSKPCVVTVKSFTVTGTSK
ncbi:MAG: hypothetical protein D3926_05075 [Desulfobacteraceae bacterium]|nr:MAG: hypothetical protein D3926_05075 [Desulfobacteraceae bacterium]